MLFCSQAYALFFAVVLATYWMMPRRPARYTFLVLAATVVGRILWHALPFDALGWLSLVVVAAVVVAELRGPDRGRVWLLLLASYYFYACWNRWLAALILASTTADYLLARAMEATERGGLRRLLLAVSVVGNLGLLVYFKYANFFLDSLREALHGVGVHRPVPVLEVLLPIGISFYTFEAINYTVDVYRKQTKAEPNLANFVLFITFFPHLVAGPIVRARDFLPQMRRAKHWSWVRAEVGVRFFLMGLFKKLALADRMAEFADPVFADPAAHSSTACWIAVVAYAIQIYGDFSGYSDMAVGSAHLLGYRLTQNFNMPYLATNPSDFWRRWHMSLSTWLRDYLFIPLGGSQKGPWRTRLNLVLTMTLGGLWHGARWTFVAWGVLHGVWLVLHREFRLWCEQRPRLDALLQSRPGTALRMATTLLGVMLLWVFFRAGSFEAAWALLGRLDVSEKGLGIPLARQGLTLTVVAVILAHVLGATGWGQRLLARTPAPALGVAYAALLSVTLTLAPATDAKAFIYFQF